MLYLKKFKFLIIILTILGLITLTIGIGFFLSGYRTEIYYPDEIIEDEIIITSDDWFYTSHNLNKGDAIKIEFQSDYGLDVSITQREVTWYESSFNTLFSIKNRTNYQGEYKIENDETYEINIRIHNKTTISHVDLYIKIDRGCAGKVRHDYTYGTVFTICGGILLVTGVRLMIKQRRKQPPISEFNEPFARL